MISVKTNAPAFCFAGLYSKIELPNFSGYTYTVLTEASGGPIEGLHHRMPVMLDESAYEGWLGCQVSIDEVTRIDPTRLKFHQVGPEVGNVRNNYPELMDVV